MNCPRGRREGGELQLWSLVVVLVANLVTTCNADYTLKTKGYILVNISTILSPAFTRLEGTGSNNSDFVGLIPEMLKALNVRKALNDNYHIVSATDNEIGKRKQDGRWTGLMGDVLSTTNREHTIGAGPILNTTANTDDFNLSEPWATAFLTLVVKSSSVTTLRQALDSDMTIMAVANSIELETLHRKAASDTELQKLKEKIYKDKRFVDTLEQGLKAAKAETNTGVLTNCVEARYHVSHGFCGLRKVETSHSIGGFVFVFARNDSTIESFNDQLRVMAGDGSLARLRARELGDPGSCNKGGAIRLENVLAFLLVVATFKSAQIMI